MNSVTELREALCHFRPSYDRLVCIDSDGCVFDSMEVKQKQCFHGLIVEFWNLQGIESVVRECAEFVNLYSKGRGRNRFVCLLDTLDLCRRHPQARAADGQIPRLQSLRHWVQESSQLSNPALKAAVTATEDRDLATVLRWSEVVNARISAIAVDVPAFPWARKALSLLRSGADVAVVSQTPAEALQREWQAAGLRDSVALIAGQETGTKSAQIAMIAAQRYAPEQTLMIGDAPGDETAADDNGIHFYPIIPGEEDSSWRCFHNTFYPLFCNGSYGGRTERELRRNFHAVLPEKPGWQDDACGDALYGAESP